MGAARAAAACALVAGAFALLAGCATPPRYEARGEIGGEPVTTSVDSAIARYYLENFLQGRHEDAALDERIGALHRRYPRPAPTREDLAALSREASVDFAALFLAHRLLADECNREVNRAFMRHLAQRGAGSPDASQYLLLFVPGWDYADQGHVTGADFARPRALAARHGFDHRMAALLPNASIESNARILALEIARHARSGKRIILASASSAGPTVHLALGEVLAPGDRVSIAGWVNIGGILQGSPIVEHLQVGPRRLVLELGLLWKGWERDAVLSLGTTRGRARFARLRLDPRILVVNYLGIPLSGQVGRYSRDNYPVLAREGPNDGLTLLADAIAPGSLTVLAFGSDHFFAEDPRSDEKTVALMKLMVEELGNGRAARCRAAG